MKTSILVVALLLGSVVAMRKGDQPCRRKSSTPIKHVLKAPLEEVSLPDTWIWNSVGGVNYLTNLRN